MCKSANEIQELKLKREFEEFTEYRYNKGDTIEYYGTVTTLESDWSDYISCSELSYPKSVFWLPAFEQLLKLFDPKDDFFSILHFSNFLQDKMTEDHGYGLLFPTKEMIALSFIMERKFNVKSGWNRNSRGQLDGGWIR